MRSAARPTPLLPRALRGMVRLHRPVKQSPSLTHSTQLLAVRLPAVSPPPISVVCSVLYVVEVGGAAGTVSSGDCLKSATSDKLHITLEYETSS